MVELRRGNRDAVGPDGSPTIGRGYEVCDDTGTPLPPEQVAPEAFTDIAVVEAIPTSAEERDALRTAAFGVGRPVLLRPEDDGVALLDASGTVRGGRVHAAAAEGTRALLEQEAGLATWVCWEWLHEEGRSGVHVALSRPELEPRPLGTPPQRRAGAGLLADRRIWLALAAVVIALLVAFVACT